MKIILRHFVRALDERFQVRLSRMKYSKRSYRNKSAVVGNDSLDKSTKRLISSYWSGVKVNSKFVALYNKINNTASFDVRYVSDDLFYCYIDPFYNNTDAAQWMDDKNYYDLLFKDVPQATFIARKMNGILLDANYEYIDINSVVDLCKGFEEVVVKKSVNSEGGHGVHILNATTVPEKLRSLIQKNHDLVIQEVVRQHPVLAAIHPSSINTLRIMSLLHDGEVHILSTILRMGRGGSRIDNASSGGIFCGVDESGKLKKYAYDVNGNRWDCHPSGVVFEGYEIPGVDKCKDIVRANAIKIARFCKMPSWDFAIDKNGEPILIEVNMSYGQLDFHQMTNGPLFKDLTLEMLNEVFASQQKRLLRRVF